MKTILGLFSLVLATSTALGINTVLVTTNHLDIPFTGTYATKNLVKLGNYSLTWQQAGKSADIFANLPTNIPAGTYTLTLQGATPVSVEIGSVNAEASLNARVDAETARAGNAEAGLTNGINTEATRATTAEAGLSNSISAETTRAVNAEADLANLINTISNSIVANVNDRINATSNSIVASLTKKFTAAFAFGAQVVSNNASVPFSSFVGDWADWNTNGTAFKIPATGVYQISFAINADGNQYPFFNCAIQITDVNTTSTNGLAFFTYDTLSRDLNQSTLTGQTTVQCSQGDLISIDNLSSLGGFISSYPISYGYNLYGVNQDQTDVIYQPTNIPSATLSIIQIQ